jgi:Cdc6-like AAA superfamily ATPase
MNHLSGEFKPIELPRDAQDPRWGAIIRHVDQLRDYDAPPGMIELGSYVVERTVGSTSEVYTAAALVGGLGERHIALPEDELLESRVAAARTAALRMLESQPPGTVKLSVYDGPLTGKFGDFVALGSELYERVEPTGLSSFLDRQINRHSRLDHTQIPVGSAAEPWQISVIVGTEKWRDDELEKLNRLIAAGPKYGSIITSGLPVQPSEWLRRGWPYPVVYNDPVDVASACREIAETSQGAKSPELGSILAGEIWSKTAHNGLDLSPGLGPDGQPHEITIGDNTPHILITGPSGTGKTVLEKSLILSLAHNYSPTEARVMLLDFKEGTEFATFAPSDRDQTFLPNASVVGTNMNADPEFGIAALEKLAAEIQHRGERARQVGATKYAELRHKDPSGEWPRIVLIMDEFQVLLNSARSKEAVALLDDIARRGRSFGVHLLLSTQDVNGIEALYTKSLFNNFSLRIAMKHGSLLKPENMAPNHLPDHHAIVNKESGEPWANVVVKVPDASSQELIAPYMHQYFQRWQDVNKADLELPRVFDGQVSPDLSMARDFRRLREVDLHPKALVAAEMSVEDASASFTMSRDPDHNLAVIGQRREEVNRILHAATTSLAKQHRPDQAAFTLVCLDSQSAESINDTAIALRDQGHRVQVVPAHKAPHFFAETSTALDPESEQPHYITVFGADANGGLMKRPITKEHAVAVGEREIRVASGSPVMAGLTLLAARKENYTDVDKEVAAVNGTVEVRDGQVFVVEVGKSGQQHLRDLLHNGPENGVHIMASFSDTQRLREVAAELGKPASIGVYVAFGIPQNELGSLTPDMPYITGQIAGINRPDRGVYYDRFSNKPPRIIIPYAIQNKESFTTRRAGSPKLQK